MPSLSSIIRNYFHQSKMIFPGLFVATLVALAAKFLSEHYGAPAMLLALLLGIALHFLAEEGKCVDGVKLVLSQSFKWRLHF